MATIINSTIWQDGGYRPVKSFDASGSTMLILQMSGRGTGTPYINWCNFNGDNLTLALRSAQQYVGTDAWYLQYPDPGVYNLSWERGNGTNLRVRLTALTGLWLESSPVLDTGITIASVPLTTEIGGWVTGVYSNRDNYSVGPGAGVTQTDNAWNSSHGHKSWMGYMHADATTETMSMTGAGGTDRFQGVSWKPAPPDDFVPRLSMVFSKVQDFYNDLRDGVIPRNLLEKRYNDVKMYI